MVFTIESSLVTYVCLEGKVVALTFCCSFGSDRALNYGSSHSGRSTSYCGGSSGSVGDGHASGGINLYAINLPCTYGVEPATVVFASVEVEAYGEGFAGLNVELTKTILAKNVKYAASGILASGLDGFDDERLAHPSSAGAGRSTSACFENVSNFTCNFHIFEFCFL